MTLLQLASTYLVLLQMSVSPASITHNVLTLLKLDDSPRPMAAMF